MSKGSDEFRRITVPYPQSRVENGVLIRTCPACGQELAEETDQFGELMTNHYAAHYSAAHLGER